MPTESRAPLLLPQNRKLRHLQGIWLRNLSFARPTGRTADDVSLNTSSAKLDSLREPPKLHHARSSESLRQPARRRSTTLSHESPVSEQKKLEAIYDSLVADVFFSLHCPGEEEPVYISEQLDRKTNFNFLPFDLKHHASDVRRSSILTIKIWAKRPVGSKEWFLHQEEEVDLRNLKFLGTLIGQHHPPNGLIFHLIDGVYSLDLPGKQSKPRETATLPTSSYNALMKLATLDNSIQDALVTHERVKAQINDILDRRPSEEAPMAEQRAELAQKYQLQQSRGVKAATRKRDELKASIRARQEAIAAGRKAQEDAETDVSNAREKLEESKQSIASMSEHIRGQRRRICSELFDIFPITPSPSGTPLSFQICGLNLPNTTYDTATSKPADDDHLSAALGQAALLVHNLQYYLSVPLPYPVTPFASRTTIRDDISLLTDIPRSASSASASARSAASFRSSSPAGRNTNPARDFPLYLPRGGSTAAHFRFDYAWFLLNKNIEALCASQSLHVVDIRHTLPNLKYLLYVCSAGHDDIPQRKRGGVRGLLAGRIKGKMSTAAGDQAGDGDSSVGGSSRRNSADSEALGRQRDELRKAAAAAGGFASGGDDALDFDEVGMKVSLRTKGFRENVGK